MKLQIKKGKELSVKEIEKWNNLIYEAFKEDKPLNSRNRKEFTKNIFFILYNKKQILAVGRLIPVKIRFMDKTYNLLGIADIVSVFKRKGYGKKVVRGMIRYAKDKKQTTIGFCESKNASFYKKCGLEIKRGMVKNFIYKNKKGKVIKNKEDEDVIYLNTKDNLMKMILENPKEKVFIPNRHW